MEHLQIPSHLIPARTLSIKGLLLFKFYLTGMKVSSEKLNNLSQIIQLGRVGARFQTSLI